MDNWITPEIVSMIKAAKKHLPAGWRIQTIETDAFLVLHIDKREFEKYSIRHQIQIAEVYNELCERIKTTGCPCFIQKV